MKKWSLNLICCPVCRGKLDLKEAQEQDDEVITGVLNCPVCDRTFVIDGGVPRLVIDPGGRKEIAENWGYQWGQMADGKLETETYYGATEEEEIRTFFEYFGISAVDIAGKKVLDVGCGPGRLTKALGKYGARVIGIDIATSIERVYEYCQAEPNVDIVLADMENPPFHDASFDYVYSRYSLCYVLQPETAFGILSRLVRPGGRFFVGMPSRNDPGFTLRLKDFLLITTHIPGWFLLNVCRGLAPLLWMGRKLFLRSKDSLRTNVFLLFNPLHTRFSRHSSEEIVAWFTRTNFDEITDLTRRHSVNVRGTKN
jgi:SAM-dependent methyltransferase